ncbi:MAG: DNA polymerase IV [Syntrophorhabdaceae bacterium]|nr:DNA polymerase IV [Syntrophorhabdaceae bacterium]
MEKIIMCIDMDAFFASVEQKSNPRLLGKPVAVIGSGSRTVITTASYEARRFGVKTGMTVYEARRLCPDLILVRGNSEKYIDTCRELEGIYRDFTPHLELYSIDEAFLDITRTHHLFNGPERVAALIKGRIMDRFGITCTVGIGPNLLIAKLASDMAKPDGMKWIKIEDVGRLLEELPVGELWGIGPATEKALNMMGIKTCGQLGRTPVSVLRSRFGILGESLKTMGMGIWTRPLITGEERPVSVGHSLTLPRDVWKREEMESWILLLSDKVARRARGYGYEGRTVSLTLRYPDFETFTKQKGLHTPTNDTHQIYRQVLSILDSIRLRDRVRLIGVRLSGLTRESNQMSLFSGLERRKALFKAIDTINNRYGELSLAWAASICKEGPSGRPITPSTGKELMRPSVY